MQILLEAIKFNHDPNSLSHDAMNIRRNATESVTIPEWRQGETPTPEQSPCAYAINETRGNELTIQAKFRRLDPSLEMVEVQAINILNGLSGTASKNVLGRVSPEFVSFGDQDETEFQSFILKETRLDDVGVSSSVTSWQWQFRVPPSSDWHAFETTHHRVYTTLNAPTLPWAATDFSHDNIHMLWTEVLDVVCDWAANKNEINDAAEAVTRGLRDIEKRISITYHFDPFYSNPDFNCSGFLSLLKDELGAGARINCSDCATIVSTFVNALGGDLFQSAMSAPFSFVTNPVRLFGRTVWKPVGFAGHELAWENQCTEQDEVFDACLEVDIDPDPTAPPQTPFLPANMRFGSAQAGGKDYVTCMAAPQQPFGLPSPEPASKQRRDLRPSPDKPAKSVSPRVWRQVKEHFDYRSWRGCFSPTRRLFFANIKFQQAAFPNWHFLRQPELVTKSNRGPIFQLLVRIPQGLATQALRIDLEICSSERAARHFLLQHLGRSETFNIHQVKDPNLADVAFFEPEHGSLFFATANAVVIVRHIDTNNTDPTAEAYQVTRFLTHFPDDDSVNTGKWFSDPEGTVHVGDLIPLTPAGSAEVPMFRFHSSVGSLRFFDGRFFYIPNHAGHEALTICGTRDDGTSITQRLDLDVA